MIYSTESNVNRCGWNPEVAEGGGGNWFSFPAASPRGPTRGSPQ